MPWEEVSIMSKRREFDTLGRVDPAVAAEDSGDGAGTGHALVAPDQEPGPELTAAPSRMSVPYLEHRSFHLRGRPHRRRPLPPPHGAGRSFPLCLGPGGLRQ